MRSLSIRQDTSNTIQEQYQEELSEMDLKQLVNELFSYLDYKEESDSGREFHPVVISSCRVLMTPCLNMLLQELRKKVNE